MIKSPTFRFSIGCSFIVLLVVLAMLFPGWQLVFQLFILLAVGVCIRQWYRRTRDLKNQIAQEQTIRLAADQYINAKFKQLFIKEQNCWNVHSCVLLVRGDTLINFIYWKCSFQTFNSHCISTTIDSRDPVVLPAIPMMNFNKSLFGASSKPLWIT